MTGGSHVSWVLKYSDLLVSIRTGVVDVSMRGVPNLGRIFSKTRCGSLQEDNCLGLIFQEGVAISTDVQEALEAMAWSSFRYCVVIFQPNEVFEHIGRTGLVSVYVSIFPNMTLTSMRDLLLERRIHSSRCHWDAMQHLNYVSSILLVFPLAGSYESIVSIVFKIWVF